MLTRKNDNWYGTCGKDIWFALEQQIANLFDFRFAVCECGNTTFRVCEYAEYLDETFSRWCCRCNREHHLDKSVTEEHAYHSTIYNCICGDLDFEVLGAVSRSDFAPVDEPGTGTFYLGLRCIGCGSLDCSGRWNDEHRSPRDWLDAFV